MKIIGWIRLGDKAACGGTVVEGENRMTYNGIPFAFQGARIACQKHCTIMQAHDHITLPNGRHVPHHGHLTSGGCPLMSTANDQNGWGNSSGESIPSQFVQNREGDWVACLHDSAYDLTFFIRDQVTALPLSNVRYRITLESGKTIEGKTNANGLTENVFSDSPELATIEAPYYGDSSTASNTDLHPGSCGC